MPLKVFVSHHMSKKDLAVIDPIIKRAEADDIRMYLAERDPKAGELVSEKVKREIRDSDCVLAVFTKAATRSEWVQQEIGLAKGLGKDIVPLVEQGAKVGALLCGIEYISFRRREIEDIQNKVINRLEQLKKVRKKRKPYLL